MKDIHSAEWKRIGQELAQLGLTVCTIKEIAAKDARLAATQKALEMACKSVAADGNCPVALGTAAVRPECGDGLKTCNKYELSDCWKLYFTERAKKEAKK